MRQLSTTPLPFIPSTFPIALIASYLSRGFAGEELELCILGVVLARQCCSEGAHVFPLYPHWFAATFGSSATTPAPAKKEFTFLVSSNAVLPRDLLYIYWILQCVFYCLLEFS